MLYLASLLLYASKTHAINNKNAAFMDTKEPFDNRTHRGY